MAARSELSFGRNCRLRRCDGGSETWILIALDSSGRLGQAAIVG